MSSGVRTLPLLPIAVAVLHLSVSPGWSDSLLFPGDSLPGGGPSAPTDSELVRRRIVDVTATRVKVAGLETGRNVVFNLFEDVVLSGVPQALSRRSAESYTWSGPLRTDPTGSFVLTVEQGVIVANLRAPGHGSFQLRSLDGERLAIQEIDQGLLPACGGSDADPDGLLGARGRPPEPTFGADDGSLLDVLVVYTAAARRGAGGETSMRALVNLAVDETNLAFAASGVVTRLRLVGVFETAYDESGDPAVDLMRLQLVDGHMDEVLALRNSTAADVVSLWVETGTTCGHARLMTNLSYEFETAAFSVTKRACATGNYTFGHEISHNLGCCHAAGDGGGCQRGGLHSYSNGWRFTGRSGDLWRTVMAYSPGMRLGHFSNPDVRYDGAPTGVPVGEPNESHNALTINEAALTAANWRQSVPLLVRPDGTGDFPTIQAALDAAPGGATIVLADGLFQGDGNRDLDLDVGGKAITLRSASANPAACVIDCGGSESEPHRGLQIHDGAGTSSLIAGITIRHAFVPIGDPEGGALRCTDSVVMVDDCVFLGNRAPMGGGAFFWNSVAVLSGCVFLGNAGGSGGAVQCSGTGRGVKIVNCSFSGNRADGGTGSALGCYAASPIVERTILAFGEGAAIGCWGTANPELACCDIFGNLGGDWVGHLAGQSQANGNFSADPLFCGAAAGDLTLDRDSPCLSGNHPAGWDCGRIGARGEGAPVSVAASNCAATDDRCDVVLITWDDNSDEEAGFVVFRSGAPLDTTVANATSYVDATATPWVAHEYAVLATNGCGDAGLSGADTGMRGGLAAAATGCEASDSRCDAVVVTWRDVSETETGFKVLRNDTLVAVTLPNVEAYADVAAPAGRTCRYRIVAVNGCGDGQASNTNDGRRPAPPAAPDSVRVVRASPKDARRWSFALRWRDNSSDERCQIIYCRTGKDSAAAVVDTVGANITAADVVVPVIGEPKLSFAVSALNCGFEEMGQWTEHVIESEDEPVTLISCALDPVVPTPFRPGARVSFATPGDVHSRLTIFDAGGRRIAVIAEGVFPAGTHRITWDGQDDRGRRVASGVYFLRMTAPGFREVRRLILLE